MRLEPSTLGLTWWRSPRTRAASSRLYTEDFASANAKTVSASAHWIPERVCVASCRNECDGSWTHAVVRTDVHRLVGHHGGVAAWVRANWETLLVAEIHEGASQVRPRQTSIVRSRNPFDAKASQQRDHPRSPDQHQVSPMCPDTSVPRVPGLDRVRNHVVIRRLAFLGHSGTGRPHVSAGLA